MTNQEFKVVKYIIENNMKVRTVMQSDKTFADERILDNASIISTIQKINELIVDEKK